MTDELLYTRARDLDTSQSSRIFEIVESDENWTGHRILANSCRQAIDHFHETVGRPWRMIHEEDHPMRRLLFVDYRRIQADENTWEKTMRQLMIIGFVK